MYKIKTFNTLSPIGLQRFSRDRYEISSDHHAPDALILRSYDLTQEVIPASVLAIARAGAGVNNIPVASLTQKGIPVFNTPGANANAVKELVLAGLLLASRNICQSWDYTRHLANNADTLDRAVESGKKQFVGFELPGKILAVIGLGAVGVKVANAAHALGMRVIGYDPGISVERAWELTSEVEKAESLNAALQHAHFVSLHVPLNEKTQHLIDKQQLQLLQKGATLLNCARGGIVNENELAEALDNGHILYYVTDFPNAELKDHPRVIALPHLGASTIEAEENCAVMAAEELIRYLENGDIQNAVNFPNVSLPRTEGYRLAVCNANVPNMVGQISTTLAQANLNIIDMINKSKAEVAYTLIDVAAAIPPHVLDDIAAIPGVLKTHYLAEDKRSTDV